MRKFSKIASVSASLLAIVQAGQAFAQAVPADGADSADADKDIVVVGSLIRGT